jgi:oligopeptide/dipeptide ABC transporter ATP-binding protein
MTAAVLQISGLRVQYGSTTAVDGVDLQVRAGQRVGLVGESGSGKSTLAFASMRLLRPPGRAIAGSVFLSGQDMLALDEAACNEIRGRGIGMVYQDPFTYLNPLIRVGDQIAEALPSRGGAGQDQVLAMLEQVGLRPASALARRYPHQLSGGQRQRVVIAMALITSPRLLIADEPTTALDVTVQAQILRVLTRIITERGTALLLISHNLAVIRLMCEFVYVMYAGRIVEFGPTQALFASPAHPYTQALLRASHHDLDGDQRFVAIPGAPPDLRVADRGCRFASRCPLRAEICAQAPLLTRIGQSASYAACWRAAPL